MNNIKIFRARRGEGKTKWLAERIKERAEAGYNCYYFGGDRSFNSVKEFYEATYHEICPIKRSDDYRCTGKNCFFTDEYFDNLVPIRMQQIGILFHDEPWYITMGQEYFVN